MHTLLAGSLLLCLGTGAWAQGFSPIAPPTIRTITVGYESQKEKFTVGKKIKSRRVSVPITITVQELPGKLLAVESASYYAGTNTQYNYVSPACLNSFWCHLLAGDPGAISQAVYQPYTVFVIQGADSTYGAYVTGVSIAPAFAVNKPITYALNGGTLYLFDGSIAYPLTIAQQIANVK
jgi:hypothetical protein